MSCKAPAPVGTPVTTAAAAVVRACAAPIVSANLGMPSSFGQPAEFTTDGSPLYVSATGFHHDGMFDLPQGATEVSVGRTETPLTYDSRGFVLDHVVQRAVVWEGALAQLKLPPGRYWIVDSSRQDLTLDGCSAGAVTDPKVYERKIQPDSSTMTTTR